MCAGSLSFTAALGPSLLPVWLEMELLSAVAKIILGLLVNFSSPNVVIVIRDSFTLRAFNLGKYGFGFVVIDFHFESDLVKKAFDSLCGVWLPCKR